MSEFTWTTNDFELSEYLTSNDNRMLPTAFTEGEIIREINSLEKKYAALKRENEVFRQGCGMDGCKMPDIVKLLSYVLTAEEQE